MWIRREKTFTFNGRRVVYTTQVVDEPESGTAYGPEITLQDVVSGTDGEVYVGGLAVGPAEATLEISLDGGMTWDDLADGPVAVGGSVGVEQDVMVRVALTPMTGLVNARATLAFGAEVGGSAGYAD